MGCRLLAKAERRPKKIGSGVLKLLWPCLLPPESKGRDTLRWDTSLLISSSADKQRLAPGSRWTNYTRHISEQRANGTDPHPKPPFDFNFRKRSAYSLQNCVAAKNHSPLRQAKPCLTICGIIYLRHIAVGQRSHYFASHFLKKGVRKKPLLQKLQRDHLCSLNHPTASLRWKRYRQQRKQIPTENQETSLPLEAQSPSGWMLLELLAALRPRFPIFK